MGYTSPTWNVVGIFREGVGHLKKTKVVIIISATILSHSIPVGELPKKIWDKSEHPKGSHKPVEILSQNTKEMARKNGIFFFVLAITF